MASQGSVASTQPDQRHLRLIAAAAQANEARVSDILAEEPPWTSSTDHDALRQALQKVAARGKLSIVRLLLEHGADVNVKRESESPALVKAAEGGHATIVSELLEHGADPNARSRTGQTALFSACMRGHNKTVQVLLGKGANIEALDKEGRSPLLFLASEKPAKAKWTVDTLKLLVENKADLEVKDHIGRTPLLWAATNGNVELARVLLENNANISATNYRGRTPLHLAAESNDKTHRAEMVRLLLDHHANPSAVSDGGWTPLHNATQSGHIDVVNLLLGANANLNAELSNGMTPLHWAAFNGSEDIVRVLLEKPGINLNVKDSFDRTPMLCAAEKHHTGIVQLLSPARSAHRLSPLEEKACKAFEATIVDFGQFEKKQLVSKHSVYELLYGWDHENDKPKVPTLTKNIKYEPDFRWIHLPANNITWVETLLAKSFIEAGHRDIESFKALEKCFDQEHRGPFAHAHFMRTFCHRIPSPRSDASERRDDKTLTTLSEEHSETSTRPATHHGGGGDSGGGESASRRQSDLAENGTGAKKKSKAELFAERHPKKSKRAKGPPGNPPHRQDTSSGSLNGRFSAPLAWETSRFAASSGKIVLFMPFLHYETDERRRMMSSAIKSVREGRRLADNDSRDSLLFKAYLNSTPPLHPRRTLDQFFYHGIDTSARDTDQVVYRYCKRHHVETKVFMVDQLWLWIIGKDLIITCFPQRWDQPKQDPLNVLDGIIEETNAKTRPLIQSVYDLAMLITSRCSGLFDRHRLDDQNYQFLDMFENSIGVVTDRESRLFSRFNRASAQSAQWLQLHRRRRQLGRPARLGSHDSSSDSSSDSEPDGNGRFQDADRFPDALLDIGVETSLLAEIKDIRDELTIIAVILDAQFATVSDLEASVTDELRGGGGGGVVAAPSRRSTDSAVAEIRRRAKEQRRGLEMRQNDIRRMDSQAQSLYESLTDLLDLKQKHSNALEARFAGDQAVIAAKQGQTVMVFTIVTIVFLPLSFIAAFFAINLEDWAATPLTIAYVSKYMFGIGLGISIPLIAMAFKVTDIADAVGGAFAGARRAVVRRLFRAGRNSNSSKGNKTKHKKKSRDKNHSRKRSGGGTRRRKSMRRGKTGYIYSTDDYDDDNDNDDYSSSSGDDDDAAAGEKIPIPPGKLSLSSRREELPFGGLRDRDRDRDHHHHQHHHGLPPLTAALRKASLGSGGAGGGVSWARPSFERRGGGIGTRFSADLERGEWGRG
ncbi:hypothetical protein F4809DRAFT_641949 [Biscogniauxia mediterranea]|nr:hypothetical protein F4809DRAFT_641949 [Biscogniauxia mediterranea]